MVLVPLLERQARIAVRKPFRLGPRERDVGAAQPAEIAGAHAGEQVPSRVAAQRSAGEDRVDSGHAHAVPIRPGDEDGVRSALDGRQHSLEASPRVEPGSEVQDVDLVHHAGRLHAGNGGKERVVLFQGHERVVLEARVVALRRLDSLVGPLVQRDRQGPWGDADPAQALGQVLAQAGGLRGGEQAGRPDVTEAVLEVQAHVVRQPDGISQAVIDVERCLPLPEDELLVDLEDERIRGRPLEDAVADARDRIGGHRESEGRDGVRGVVRVLVLPRVEGRVGKLDVREQAMRGGRVNGHRVEDLAVGLVLVEPQIEELALVHAGGGGARRVGTPDADIGGAECERIRIARVVAGLIAEERPDVARYRVGEPHHDGVLGRVDQLVDLERREAVEEAEIRRRPHQAGLASRAPAESPPIRSDRHLGRVGAVADRQRRVAGVGVRRFVRAPAGHQRLREGCGRHLVFESQRSHDRAAVRLGGNGKGGVELIGILQAVAVPARVHRGVSLQEQDVALANVGGRERVAAAGKSREGAEAQLDAIPAVVDAIPELVVAPRHVHRLQDEERGAVLDHPSGVLRSFVQVDDERVEGIARVDLHVSGAFQALVGARSSPSPPVVERDPLFDDEADHASLGQPGEDQRQEQRDREKRTPTADRSRAHRCSLLFRRGREGPGKERSRGPPLVARQHPRRAALQQLLGLAARRAHDVR